MREINQLYAKFCDSAEASPVGPIFPLEDSRDVSPFSNSCPPQQGSHGAPPAPSTFHLLSGTTGVTPFFSFRIMASTISLLRLDGLARSYMGDLRATVSPRIVNKTVRDFLSAKALPALSAEAATDPDSVRNWTKAIPAAHLDPARGFTASIMHFGRDIFGHFKDVSAAFPWKGASLRDVRDALKMLAVDLKATNALTDLEDYAAQDTIQRTAAFLLLRFILDDLHGGQR